MVQKLYQNRPLSTEVVRAEFHVARVQKLDSTKVVHLKCSEVVMCQSGPTLPTFQGDVIPKIH